MPINNYTYTPETAADFFAELSAAMRLLPDIAGVYSAFNRVFRKCIDRNTEAVSATLCGAFAKTDYLLKEHKAARSMARDINDTRWLSAATWSFIRLISGETTSVIPGSISAGIW